MLLLLFRILHVSVEHSLHLVPRLSALRGSHFGFSLTLCFLLEASSFLTHGLLLLATDLLHTDSFCFFLALIGLVNLFCFVVQDHLKLRQLLLLFVECVDAEGLLPFLIKEPLADILVEHVLLFVQKHFELDQLFLLTFDTCNAAGLLSKVILVLLLKVSHLLLLTAVLSFACGPLLLFLSEKLFMLYGLFLDLARHFL